MRASRLLPCLILPLAGSQRAFDEHFATLGEVLLHQVGLLAERDDAVPLGRIRPTPVAVGTTLVRGDAHVRDRCATLRVTHLGILSETTQQEHLVDAHGCTPWRWGPLRWTGSGAHCGPL